MKKFSVALMLCLLTGVAGQATARDIGFVTGLAQDQFRSLSKEAGMALAYHNVAPAAPLGVTGFDLAAEVSMVDIKKESAYWQSAFGNDAPSYLFIPRLRARKGLPAGIDVGGMYAYVPDSNIKLYGFELSKALLGGTAATPALGVRASYSRLAGVNDLDLQTVGLDASLSKGFIIITPYVGGGAVWIDSEARGELQRLSTLAGSSLKNEKFWLGRVFGGVKLTPFPFVAITAEAEYSMRPIYTLKAAIDF
jgi:hypothetical protein